MNGLIVFFFAASLLHECVSKELNEEERLDRWSRGAFDVEDSSDGDAPRGIFARMDFLRLGPVSYARRRVLDHREAPDCDSYGYCGNRFRGGGQEAVGVDRTGIKIEELVGRFGSEFAEAIERNKKEHAEDCEKSCRNFYCGEKGSPLKPLGELMGPTTVKSYSMGPIPPEDFAEDFGFPLDVIKVTETEPLFDATEAAEVIRDAEDEGVNDNEFDSGKYQLAGDWLTNLPNTLAWFNGRLERTFFPLLAHLFPEIISSPSVIRAHSVSLLKYNASHPRTDVHVDNGILALTVAMTPWEDYSGGGTYFEHMGVDNILAMDVGHATLRPGSVRHGGHRVTDGTRYILGAFLLLEDQVEHVRRLKNRGSDLRKSGDLRGAKELFGWALALNPKCATCLTDWAEILFNEKRYAEAEAKLRSALELLEYKDSDGLFTLGVVLSEMGRDDESIEAYAMSVELNAEDAELCYNLGVKLGAKGKVKEEMAMYAKAIQADPKFGFAWLNWGIALAELGSFDDAELFFRKAMGCEGEVVPAATMNLAHLLIQQGNMLASGGDVGGAMRVAVDAAKYFDQGRGALDRVVAGGRYTESRIHQLMEQFPKQRLEAHRLIGSLLSVSGDMAGSESEFRRAAASFPNRGEGWNLLKRILEIQGKTDEAKEVAKKIQSLGN